MIARYEHVQYGEREDSHKYFLYQYFFRLPVRAMMPSLGLSLQQLWFSLFLTLNCNIGACCCCRSIARACVATGDYNIPTANALPQGTTNRASVPRLTSLHAELGLRVAVCLYYRSAESEQSRELRVEHSYNLGYNENPPCSGVACGEVSEGAWPANAESPPKLPVLSLDGSRTIACGDVTAETEPERS